MEGGSAIMTPMMPMTGTIQTLPPTATAPSTPAPRWPASMASTILVPKPASCPMTKGRPRRKVARRSVLTDAPLWNDIFGLYMTSSATGDVGLALPINAARGNQNFSTHGRTSISQLQALRCWCITCQ